MGCLLGLFKSEGCDVLFLYDPCNRHVALIILNQLFALCQSFCYIFNICLIFAIC